MINVAAIRMQQFGVQFYQASLTAGDIDKLVRFEVLNYGDAGQSGVRGGKSGGGSKVNWDLLERRIASSEKAYQRQIIRRKIDELVQYYEQCRQARDLPSIAGAVIISCDEKLTFEPVETGSSVGRLKVPEREGILRAIDGQHRLLALHADIDNIRSEDFTVPAIIFDRLPEDHVVQMFVTINAKHTRLNASHLVSLSGRQLYRDDALAAAHDVVRALNDREDSPLHNEIKLLGVGHGRVAQAPLAQELKKLFASDAFGGPKKSADFREDSQVLRELLQAGVGRVRRGLERPEVQHQVGDGAARVHPRRAGRRAAAGPGARGPERFPRHRTGHRAVGPPHRRSAVRDRRRLEAHRDDRGFARAGAEAGVGVSGRRGGLSGCSSLGEFGLAGWSSGRGARRRPVRDCRPGSPQHLRRPAVNHRPTPSKGNGCAVEIFQKIERVRRLRAARN